MVWMALVCIGWAAALSTHAQSSDGAITQMQVERNEDGVFLNATIHLDFPPLVEDALLKGVPIFFVAEADVMRTRWYWYDQQVAGAKRYMRLAYQPLTRRWRVTVSPNPLGSSGLGVTLGQNYEELSDAMASLQRISHWKIAEAADLDSGPRQSISLSFRLDVSQLPRPLQIGAVGRSDWSLSATRSIRLAVEGGRE